MPDKNLRLAAAGIALCALVGFAMGLNSAGPRARLPGAPVAALTTPAAPAADAQPINLEELPPPPGPLEEEEPEAPTVEEKRALETVAVTPPVAKITLPPPEPAPSTAPPAVAAPPPQLEPPH